MESDSESVLENGMKKPQQAGKDSDIIGTGDAKERLRAGTGGDGFGEGKELRVSEV